MYARARAHITHTHDIRLILDKSLDNPINKYTHIRAALSSNDKSRRNRGLFSTNARPMVQKDVFKHHRRAEMCDVYQASRTLAKKVPRYPRYWDASKMLITDTVGTQVRCVSTQPEAHVREQHLTKGHRRQASTEGPRYVSNQAKRPSCLSGAQCKYRGKWSS